jgi:hypothetical protein
MKKIAYYITPHGFGHAVRSLEILRTLLSLDRGIDVTLVSDIPEFLVQQNVGHPLPYRRARFDIGLVQLDSIRFDLARTLSALQNLQAVSKNVVAAEAHFLKSNSIDLVVADIPFLPFRAARECSIPSMGVGNFTWDWIYSEYAEQNSGWWEIISWIRQGYSDCDLLLQLPMHGDCSACPRRQDVPLVARRATRSPSETRTILGIPSHRPIYLIAFSELGLSVSALRAIERIPEVLFLYKHPLHYDLNNGLCIDTLNISYADVVAAVDAVITKPGYGIVSDCLAHGTPMIYTDRGPFPEYPILVETMRAQLKTAFISAADLYAGDWERAIRGIGQLLPRAYPRRTDGAEVCAGTILQKLASC